MSLQKTHIDSIDFLFDKFIMKMVENESEGASSELAELAQMFALIPLTEPFQKTS